MNLTLPVVLAHSRLTMEKIDVNDVVIPESAALAYAAQDQLIGLIDSPVVGWKVGATSTASQEKLGVKAPICGPIFERTLTTSGSKLAMSSFHHPPALESEFAFTIGTDVALIGDEVTRTTAREIVSSVHVAIELVCSRFDSNFAADPALLVADGALHSLLVLGPGNDPDSAGDLKEQALFTSVDDNVIAQGTGKEVLGDPYESLAWLCKHLARRGMQLTAGSLVTTGAATGLHATKQNQTLKTEGNALGSATLSLSE